MISSARITEILSQTFPSEELGEKIQASDEFKARDFAALRELFPIGFGHGIRGEILVFDRAKLEPFRDEIEAMLLELPEKFRCSADIIVNGLELKPEQKTDETLQNTINSMDAGGDLFLNACYTKDGKQWGEHINMDQLFLLGQGLNLVNIPIPRDTWNALPGGVPIVQIVMKNFKTKPMVDEGE